jgi:two-component system sensor histidine kinase and response regulator WspE
MSGDDLSDFSMMELFRIEADSQTAILTAGLLALERDPTGADQLEACMRAAHSLKGAARIVNLNASVNVAHAMEDCFVAAQKGKVKLGQSQVDWLLSGVDLLARISRLPEAEAGKGEAAQSGEIDGLISKLSGFLEGKENSKASGPAPASVTRIDLRNTAGPISAPAAVAKESSDRMLRVTADHLNRLLGLAGESLVESRWLKPFAESMLRLKRMQHDLGKTLDHLRESLSDQGLDEQTLSPLTLAQRSVVECHRFLSLRLSELESYGHRSTKLSHSLYDEALACRMRPFADGVHGFPRMVRDLARSLGKEVKLEIVGEMTPVDRDILERLEAPLNHLVRNAVDHGIEPPEARCHAGKSREGTVRLEARHSAGMLLIIVSDDGGGISLEALRNAVVQKKLTNAETANQMAEAELLEFLFLPGFTMKAEVTEISGRGVGLDVVHDMVKQVRGNVRVSTQPGQGTRFQLQLPLTLSLVRTLLVSIGGETYAFPLAYLARALRLPKNRIQTLEGRQHFPLDGRQVGLVAAHQILGKGEPPTAGQEWPVIVIGDRGNTFGLVVDGLLGERELVVQPLDPRLGKVKDISAGAVMEDGSPVLIVDVEDLMRSLDKLISAGRLTQVQREVAGAAARQRKRVLVVDDSLTVRELERKLLSGRGYEVEVAVDGMDGWNAVRTGQFNLVVTDIDMPRMDGIELVSLIRKDAHLKSLRVMVVSYKEREEDRRRGLDAGADYYLTKGSFHDETLLHAVTDLIGEPIA